YSDVEILCKDEKKLYNMVVEQFRLRDLKCLRKLLNRSDLSVSE
ncbi:5367_t:CDS:1, partial [Rhizophagus irregularis]